MLGFSGFLCYTTQALNNTKTNSNTPKCNQCGSDLILQATTTEKDQRSFAPMTRMTYLCSNQACQDGINDRTAKRIALKNEQDLARQKRLEKAAEEKANKQATTT